MAEGQPTDISELQSPALSTGSVDKKVATENDHAQLRVLLDEAKPAILKTGEFSQCPEGTQIDVLAPEGPLGPEIEAFYEAPTQSSEGKSDEGQLGPGARLGVLNIIPGKHPENFTLDFNPLVTGGKPFVIEVGEGDTFSVTSDVSPNVLYTGLSHLLQHGKGQSYNQEIDFNYRDVSTVHESGTRRNLAVFRRDGRRKSELPHWDEVITTDDLDQEARQTAWRDLHGKIMKPPLRNYSELPRQEQRDIEESLVRNTTAIVQMIGKENYEVWNIYLQVTDNGRNLDTPAARFLLKLIDDNIWNLQESFSDSGNRPRQQVAANLLSGLLHHGDIGLEANNFLLKNFEQIVPLLSVGIPPNTARAIVLRGTEAQRDEFRSGIVSFIDGTDEQKVASGVHTIQNLFKTREGDYISPANFHLLIAEAKGLFKNVFSGYGLDAEDMITAWQESTSIEKFGDVLTHNYEVILSLEKQNPGICARLRDSISRIHDFARYPEEILIDQDTNKDNLDLQYGGIFFPYVDQSGRNSGAFYESREGLRSLYDGLKKLNESLSEDQPKYGLRVFEGSRDREGRDDRDLYLRMMRAKRIYGPMLFAVLGDHGTEKSIGSLKQADLETDVVKNTVDCFVQDPNIILVSCRTGALGGIGQTISEMGATIFAPDKDTNIASISVIRDSVSGKLDFTVEYTAPGAAKTYAAGQPSTQGS